MPVGLESLDCELRDPDLPELDCPLMLILVLRNREQG